MLIWATGIMSGFYTVVMSSLFTILFWPISTISSERCGQRWDIVESLEFFKVHIKYSLWNTCPDSGRRQRYYKPKNEDSKRLLLSIIMLVFTPKYAPTQPEKVYADIKIS